MEWYFIKHNQLNNVKAIEAIEVLLNEHFSLLLDYSKLENLWNIKLKKSNRLII